MSINNKPKTLHLLAIISGIGLLGVLFIMGTVLVFVGLTAWFLSFLNLGLSRDATYVVATGITMSAFLLSSSLISALVKLTSVLVGTKPSEDDTDEENDSENANEFDKIHEMDPAVLYAVTRLLNDRDWRDFEIEHEPDSAQPSRRAGKPKRSLRKK